MTNTNLPFPQFTKTEGVPSSWTKGKMTKLLLLSGLSSWAIKGVKGGQAFENCLITNHYDYYSALLDYDFYNNEGINNSLLVLCCDDNNQCTNNPSCGSDVYCTRVGQTIVCTIGPGICGGVVGNTTILLTLL